MLRYPYGPNELYHISADPDETKNLFGDPSQEERIVAMRRQMEEWFLRYSDPDLDGRKEGVTGTASTAGPGAGHIWLRNTGPCQSR